MLWNKLMQLIFGGSLMVAQTLPPDPLHIQTSMDELLSYECAKSVAGLLYPEDQMGPVFSNLGLVFTSIEARDNSRLLVVNAGAGTFSVALVKAGVNRISFSIPAFGAIRPKTFFISYLHDTVTHSRVFDISTGKPPSGKEKSSYTVRTARRAEGLLPNFDYSIHETAEDLLASLTEGKLRREQVQRSKADNCEHITRKSPALGRNLKRNLDVVDMIVMGPKPTKIPGRMPASVALVQKEPAKKD